MLTIILSVIIYLAIERMVGILYLVTGKFKTKSDFKIYMWFPFILFVMVVAGIYKYSKRIFLAIKSYYDELENK